MGKKKRSRYFKSLDELAKEKLESMISFGESKSEDRKEDDEGMNGHIYSRNTYKNYRRHVLIFTKWVKENYPECTTLKAAKKHVPEWLERRADYVDENGKAYSAWTLSTDTAAVNKLYELDGTVDAFKCPEKRERTAIKRSRVDAVRDSHFSKTNNAALINFCEGTGARRAALEKMTGDDYWTRERMQKRYDELSAMDESTLNKQEGIQKNALKEALTAFSSSDIAALGELTDFVYYRQDKGGKYRFAPIIGPHRDDIVRLMRETKKREEVSGKPEKVWQHVHSCCDCHGYRGTYAKTLYKMCARNIEDIPYDRYHNGIHRRYQSDVYVCRKEEAGRRFDKRAIRVCTKALGHNRLNVVVDNYLYGI